VCSSDLPKTPKPQHYLIEEIIHKSNYQKAFS